MTSVRRSSRVRRPTAAATAAAAAAADEDASSASDVDAEDAAASPPLSSSSAAAVVRRPAKRARTSKEPAAGPTVSTRSEGDVLPDELWALILVLSGEPLSQLRLVGRQFYRVVMGVLRPLGATSARASPALCFNCLVHGATPMAKDETIRLCAVCRLLPRYSAGTRLTCAEGASAFGLTSEFFNTLTPVANRVRRLFRRGACSLQPVYSAVDIYRRAVVVLGSIVVERRLMGRAGTSAEAVRTQAAAFKRVAVVSRTKASVAQQRAARMREAKTALAAHGMLVKHTNEHASDRAFYLAFVDAKAPAGTTAADVVARLVRRRDMATRLTQKGLADYIPKPHEAPSATDSYAPVHRLCERFVGGEISTDELVADLRAHQARLTEADRWRIEAERQSEERRRQLVRALAQHHLQLRADSALCQQYIDGTTPRSLTDVVNVMREMHWYFGNTNYSSIRSGMFSSAKLARLSRTYYHRCNRYDRYDHHGDDSFGDELNGYDSLEDEDDYDDYNDYDDPVAISEQAKTSALHSWASEHVNADLSGVPETLHAAIRGVWALHTTKADKGKHKGKAAAVEGGASAASAVATEPAAAVGGEAMDVTVG